MLILHIIIVIYLKYDNDFIINFLVNAVFGCFSLTTGDANSDTRGTNLSSVLLVCDLSCFYLYCACT